MNADDAPRPAGGRRLGRIIAMQALFEFDAAGNNPEAAANQIGDEQGAGKMARALAARLIGGVVEHLDEIDALITEAAPQWPLEQLAAVDRAVLRIAIFELRFGGGTPPKVAVNEAVEVAKSYGSEASGRFVNGVLGHVMSGE
jgi:N utilization substance protein B